MSIYKTYPPENLPKRDFHDCYGYNEFIYNRRREIRKNTWYTFLTYAVQYWRDEPFGFCSGDFFYTNDGSYDVSEGRNHTKRKDTYTIETIKQAMLKCIAEKKARWPDFYYVSIHEFYDEDPRFFTSFLEDEKPISGYTMEKHQLVYKDGSCKFFGDSIKFCENEKLSACQKRRIRRRKLSTYYAKHTN